MALRAVLVSAILFVTTSVVHGQSVRDTIGPLEQSAQPSSPGNPIPRRIVFTSPTQPAEMARVNGVASVWLRVTLDRSGQVAEIRKYGEPPVVPAPGASLDEDLRRSAADAVLAAAVAAVRQWKYEPPATPIVFVVLVNLSSAGQPTVSQQDVQAVEAARGRLPSRPPLASPPPWPAAEAVGAVRAGNGIRPPNQTKSATPSYSFEAKKARVQGTVRVEVLVGTDGKVKDARVLQSPSPLLDQPALDAARRWEFTPTTVNGEPKPIILMLELDFNLR